MAGYRRRFGDRYDGRRLRSLDPFFKIIPYIMKNRMDSQIFFEEKVDITHTEAYIRKRNKTSETRISMLHVFIAAIVRTLALKPALNRFIAGQKIYARNEILVSLAIKKEMNFESTETTIKFKFDPTDTLEQVAAKIDKQIKENKVLESSNDTDKTARLIMLCPGFIVKFIVFVVRLLDYFGLMPKILNEVSPFHTSVFITDVGSLGISPVYHHLYDFGTTSIFVAFGTKRTEKVIDSNDNIVNKRTMTMRVVTDERIVDGHYFASAFKMYKTLIEHPERLESPPAKVVSDVD
ncbi:MAG: 2-oxo acid dehydrogenase subunit E2 [Clostridiaceae bacterium]|nr:2-oxo acid dehydrogenase subunit E2 [Clostridiaceae bacterium]